MHPQSVIVKRQARRLVMAAATQVTTEAQCTLCQAEPCCRCTSAASHTITGVTLNQARPHHHCST